MDKRVQRTDRLRALGLPGFLLLLSLLVTAARAADTQTPSQVVEDAQWARIVLHWNQPIRVESRMDGTDLLMRFDQTLAPELVSNLPQRLPQWIKDVRYGYDTLLLSPVRPVRFEVRAEGHTVYVELHAPHATPTPRPSTHALGTEDEDTQARLRALRAKVRAEKGDLVGAREDLRKLAQERPTDLQALLGLAELENRLGGWQESVALYERALKLSPESPGILRSKAYLLRRYGPELRLSWDRQEVEDADRQTIIGLSGRRPIGEHAELSASYERRELDDDAVRRANGKVEPVQETVEQLGAKLRLRHHGNAITAVSLLGGPAGAGISVSHERYSGLGITEMQLDFRKPYWALVEGLVDEATVDRVGVRHDGSFARAWQWRLGGSLNRYGMDGEHDAARSWGLEAALRYTAIDWIPQLSLAYRLDREKLTEAKTRTDAQGSSFKLLPLESREVHVVEAAWSGTLSQRTELDVFAGYSIDRLGGEGPFVGANLAYAPHPRWRLGLNLSHSLATARGSEQALDRAGAFVSMHW